MPWLSPGSNDSGGVLDDGCQPSCVEMVEITGLLPAATPRIGGQRKYLNVAGKGKVGRTPVVGKAAGGPEHARAGYQPIGDSNAQLSIPLI